MNLEFKIKNLKLEHGFTLVELLIVITIIGILAAILLANFVGVRQRARDAQRKSDLRQVQSALELYRSDNGTYPAGIYTTACPTSGPFPTGAIGGSTYMQKVPCDMSPNGSATAPYGGANNGPGNYTYSYGLSGTNNTYYINACLENTNDQDPNIDTSAAATTACTANGSTRDAYKLTNP